LFRRPPLKLILLAVLIGVALWVLNSVVEVDQADLERAIDRTGIWGPIAYAVILTLGLTVPMNPVSDLLTVTVAAVLLDPKVAILATGVAHTIAITVNYYIGYLYGARMIDRLLARRDVPLLRRVRDHITVRAIFLLRFALPLTAIGIDWISYLAGIQRLRFVPYFIASMVPWTVMSVIYFTSAALLRETSPFLVLLPAVAIIVVASSLVFVLRRHANLLGPRRREVVVSEVVSESHTLR